MEELELTSPIETLWSNPMVQKLLIVAIGIVLLLFLNGLVKKALNRSIKDTDRKYKARKAVNMIAYLLMVTVVLMVYSDQLGNIGVALGVAGAGIAFALQEVIVSIAGWLTILISGQVSVGQRVKIGSVHGDIIDIGVLNTTIMEIGGWIDGDLYNGRIVTLSNSFVYKEQVHNYSAEYPFLWDEIQVPIRTESDFVFARELFVKIVEEVCGEYAEQSQNQWKSLTNKYRVEKARVEPMVTLKFDENWITFTLRYIVDFQKRRTTKDLIFTRLLEEFKKHPEKIQIAASTLEISQEE